MTELKRFARRKPWVAGMLSLISGMGQLYNGQIFKAVLALLASSGASFVGAVLMLNTSIAPPYNVVLPALLWLGVFVAIIADAVVTAKRLGHHYELKLVNTWYMYLGVLAFVLFVYPLASQTAMQHYVQAFKIPAASMMPTILRGDHILIAKSAYTTGIVPQRGDIIVFAFPEDETKDFIKRVIALPGEEVQIINKIVYLNGEPLNESYIQHTDPKVAPNTLHSRDNLGPLILPAGSYFVMGDNRDQSLDSRFWGPVKLEKIKGKLSVIYWSWDASDLQVRWERIGMHVR